MIKKIINIMLFSILLPLDYSLEDVNPNSNTFGANIGPSYFQNQGQVISMSVFNWETWGSWRALFAQLCDLNNNNTWDTDKVSLIGVGIGSGGSGALDAMLNGASVPWVLDPSENVWDEFLGPNAPRRQIVLLDQNLEKRFQQQYSGALNNTQINELVNIIEQLIDEASILLGDMNADSILNVLDVIILVNMALGTAEIDFNVSWKEIKNNNGVLVDFIWPKKLK